jgi:hypothetical protein
MGFVGSLFGGSYKPERAKTIDVATGEQAKQLYGQTQEGLAQQQAFVNALAQQGGLANQANVINQLQNVAAGTGPNPALAALQQATGQNIAAQNALMAGQRGAGRNVGLLARQAGMQGANLQQQAAGQGATLQAQQQLGALGQLGGLTSQQVAQQQTGLAGLNQFGLSGQENILNALTQQNAQKISEQNAINQARAEQAKAGSQLLGNLIGTAGSLAMMPMTGGLSAFSTGGGGVPGFGAPGGAGGFYKAHGGIIPEKQNYAMGGMAANQPQSYVGQYFQNPNQMLGAINESDNIKDANLDYSTLNDGGAVNRDGMYAQGGMAPMSLMKQGGHVPGKAAVAGDSYKNDIVDAKLSPGEIVIPRSIVNSPNAPEMAAKFVRDTLSKKKGYADGGEVEDEEEPEVVAYDAPENKQANDDAKLLLASDVMNESYKNNFQPVLGTQQTPPQLPSERKIAETVEPPTGLEQISPASKGLEAQKRAFMETGRLAELQAKQEEQQYNENLNALQADQNKYLLELQDVNNEMNNLRSDIMQTKIDPQRFYSNMSTGNKVGTAIGLILGGIGAGLTGGENVVLKQLNNYIEQDLYAQKANLGKKESLLGGLTQKYGNVNQAMQMSRIMMSDALSLQMKRIAAQYAGKIEAQRLNAEIAKLDQSIAQQVDTFAKARMYASADGVSAEMDPYREQRVLIGNVPYYAGSTQDAQKKMEQINNIDASLATIKKMSKLRKQYGAEFYPGVAKEEMKGLKDTLLLQAGPILLGAPITERNKKLVENQIPDPTRYSDVKFSNSLDEIEGKLIRKKEDIKKSVFKTPMIKR